MPALMPENAAAVRVFSVVRDQHIMGFNGPIGLNLSAVFDVMRMYEMTAAEQRRCLRQVIAAYDIYLSHIRTKK